MKTRTLTDRVREDERHTPRQPKRLAQRGSPRIAERDLEVPGGAGPSRPDRRPGRSGGVIHLLPARRLRSCFPSRIFSRCRTA